MSIVQETNVIKLNVKYGEVDKNGYLSLKLVLTDEYSVGASFIGFSLSKSFASEIQLNLIQTEKIRNNELKLHLSSASPLFGSFDETTLTFYKL